MTESEQNHAATDCNQTDRGRNRESSYKHGIIMLQGCNRIVVQLKVFFQLFSEIYASVSFGLLSLLYDIL